MLLECWWEVGETTPTTKRLSNGRNFAQFSCPRAGGGRDCRQLFPYSCKAGAPAISCYVTANLGYFHHELTIMKIRKKCYNLFSKCFSWSRPESIFAAIAQRSRQFLKSLLMVDMISGLIRVNHQAKILKRLKTMLRQFQPAVIKPGKQKIAISRAGELIKKIWVRKKLRPKRTRSDWRKHTPWPLSLLLIWK